MIPETMDERCGVFRSEVFYLEPEVLREHADVRIVSAEGRLYKINRCILGSQSGFLRPLLEAEDVIIHTDIPSEDLGPVLDSLIEGRAKLSKGRNVSGVGSCVRALGLQKSGDSGLDLWVKPPHSSSSSVKSGIDDDEDASSEYEGKCRNSEVFSLCLKSLDEKEALNDHQCFHLKKGSSYHCVSCASPFSNLLNLKTHINETHKDLKGSGSSSNERPSSKLPGSQCVNCGQFSANDNFLDIHSSANPFHSSKCNYEDCIVSFETYSQHISHVTSVHGSKTLLKCGKCGSCFSDLKELVDHKKDKHTPIKQISETAKKYYKSVKGSSYKSVNLAREKCVCEQCGMSLSRGNMRTHMKIAHGNEPVDCDRCGKSFNHPMSLKLHADSAHREFPCEHCGFMCRSPSAYKRHLLSKHTLPELKPFQCKVCGKGFTTAYRFKQHENIHRGIKPHTCKYCGKGFCNSSNRNQHEKSIHLGTKRVKSRNNTNTDRKM